MKPLKQYTMTKPQWSVIFIRIIGRDDPFALFSELVERSIENPVEDAISNPDHIRSFIFSSLRIDALQEKW